MSIKPKKIWRRLSEEEREKVIRKLSSIIEEIIYEKIGIDYSNSFEQKGRNIYQAVDASTGNNEQGKFGPPIFFKEKGD